MPRIRYPLTPEIEQQIAGLIRAGAYDWVAAEASAIPWKVFRTWMRQGARGRQPFRRFHAAVQLARAQARARVEIEVRDKDPRFWLRHGPGRETPVLSGWSNPVKPLLAGRRRAVNPLVSSAWARLFAAIQQALAPYPQALGAVVAALESLPQLERSGPHGG